MKYIIDIIIIRSSKVKLNLNHSKVADILFYKLLKNRWKTSEDHEKRRRLILNSRIYFHINFAIGLRHHIMQYVDL